MQDILINWAQQETRVAVVENGAVQELHIERTLERGTALTTKALAARLQAWQGEGDDVALVIGGPDGLDPAFKASCDETLRLSDLTLPHAFVRALVAEAIYRAWSINAHHPYHRE